MKRIKFQVAIFDIACAEAFLETPPEKITTELQNNPNLWEEFNLYEPHTTEHKPAAILLVEISLDKEAISAGLTDPADILAALQFGATDIAFKIQECTEATRLASQN